MRLRLIIIAAAVAGAGATASCLVDTSGLSGGAFPPDAAADAPARTVISDAAAPEPVDGAIVDAAITDAAITDATLDAGASPDASVDAGPRKNSCGAFLFGTSLPLVNGDFEQGCANGWSGYQASFANDPIASNGNLACRVCYTGGDFGYFIHGDANHALAPGESYEIVACVRAIPDDDAGSSVYAEASYGSTGLRGNNALFGDAYAEVRVGFSVTEDAADFSLDVRGYSVLSGCFLVDDVSLSLIREAGAP